MVNRTKTNIAASPVFKKRWDSIEKQYQDIVDPWGLDLEHTKKTLNKLLPLYKTVFKVRVINKFNITVPKAPIMVVSNHSGQIAIDGLLISIAFATDIDHPRILRPMVERFVIKMPFFGSWAQAAGSVLGDRENCLKLIEAKQSTLVFPEGVNGVSKSSNEFYQLQEFSRGFYRMAIAGNIKILPISVVGAEEFYPYVYQLKTVAKMLSLPALPITPTFPWFGPLGAIPIPNPVDIHIGNLHAVPKEISQESNDMAIDKEILKIKNEIQHMIDVGRQNMRGRSELLKK